MDAARRNASACRAASGLACRSSTMESSRWLTTLRRQISASRIRRASLRLRLRKGPQSMRTCRESFRKTAFVVEQFAMVHVGTLHGPRCPAGNGDTSEFPQAGFPFTLSSFACRSRKDSMTTLVRLSPFRLRSPEPGDAPPGSLTFRLTWFFLSRYFATILPFERSSKPPGSRHATHSGSGRASCPPHGDTI